MLALVCEREDYVFDPFGDCQPVQRPQDWGNNYAYKNSFRLPYVQQQPGSCVDDLVVWLEGPTGTAFTLMVQSGNDERHCNGVCCLLS